MSTNKKVFLSSLKMAIATFLSRILGLVREQVMAFYFGASGFTDAFLIAYRIPNLLRDLFAEGAFSSAFVPTLIQAQGEGRDEARKLLWRLFLLLSLVTLFIGTIIIIFAPEIINLFAPTFKETPEKFELTVLLTRIMAPFLFFVSIAALFMGVLNSLKIFFIPSLAPAFFNITMILSMLFFPIVLQERNINPIISLALGVFIGGLVQAFVQFPLILKHRYGPLRVREVFSKRTKKVITLLGPGLIGFAATQINLLVNTILASSTIVGAVSWLNFAFRLFQLPVGILSVSIGNSNLVHFSKSWSDKNYDEARSTIRSSFFLSLFMVLPAMIALMLFNEEMIHLIFERGKFDNHSTMMTAKALFWYSLGLPFYSIYKIFVPSFYAIDRQKIPVMTSIGTILFNIIFCVTLTPRYGFEILALGTSLSMFFNAILLAVILKKDIGLSISDYINVKIIKIILSAIITTGIAYQLKMSFVFSDYPFSQKCILLTSYLLVIALSYFALCVFMGEAQAVKTLMKKFLKRK